MVRLMVFVIALATAAPAITSWADEPLVYEMVVTAPGTRSQGVRGILYGADGSAVEVPAGAQVDAPLGRFRSVACENLWSVCGLIREDMLAWIAEHPINAVHSGPTAFRVYRVTAADEPPAWRGVLLEGDLEVPEGAAAPPTAMGLFRPATPLSADAPWSGWIPESWRAAWPSGAVEAPAVPGDTAWRFIETMGTTVPDGAHATLAFDRQGRVSGEAGCNALSGRYDSAGDGPAFAGVGYTKMMCYGVDLGVGNSVQSVMAETYRAVVEGGELRLLAADGTVLARLVPAAR